jgi:hypothetical protein
MDFGWEAPDVVEEEFDTFTPVTTVKFTSEAFHLEVCDIQSDVDSQSYLQYIQGYMAPTPKGLELAEHFFPGSGNRLRTKMSYLMTFSSMTHTNGWYPNRYRQNSIARHFPTDYVKEIWQQFDTHPVFDTAFKFRFLVTTGSRWGPEKRHVSYFRTINVSRLITTHRYKPLIENSPNRFVRKTFHDPELSTEEITLLQTFKW